MSEIAIYKASDGHIEIKVNLVKETVWLSLKQISELFKRDPSVISRHFSNIFKNNELRKESVVAKFATTASDDKTYQVDYYNLDAIISIGYRINSLQATNFRVWATRTLKEHLISGYTFNRNRLAERGINELQQSFALLQKALAKNNLTNDIGAEAIQLITNYTKTWDLLLAYDEDKLQIPKGNTSPLIHLRYETAVNAIRALKSKLAAKDEKNVFFGREPELRFHSILVSIEQTFDGFPLYKTTEERAANLLYFIIKDHPFIDGNKRIGCLIFLLYLRLQDQVINLNDNGLIALALLVAESNPNQKNLMIRLIINLLVDYDGEPMPDAKTAKSQLASTFMTSL